MQFALLLFYSSAFIRDLFRKGLGCSYYFICLPGCGSRSHICIGFQRLLLGIGLIRCIGQLSEGKS